MVDAVGIHFPCLQRRFFHKVTNASSLIQSFGHIREAFYFFKDVLTFSKMPFRAFAEQVVGLSQNLVHLHPNFQANYTDYLRQENEILRGGAMLFSSEKKYVLLVKGFGESPYTFPRGKMNTNENFKKAAIREVYEETGFDIRGLIDDHSPIERIHDGQPIKLLIVNDVPLETNFKPRLHHEIKANVYRLLHEKSVCKLYGFTAQAYSLIVDCLRGYLSEPRLISTPSPSKLPCPRESIFRNIKEFDHYTNCVRFNDRDLVFKRTTPLAVRRSGVEGEDPDDETF